MNDTPPEIKYCLYARKSSEADEKQVRSIESQIKEMLEVAKRDELNVVEIRQESHSAKLSGQRDIFNSTAADIKASKFNGILAWLPDRVSRNAGDAAALVDLMDRGLLHEIRTHSQTFRSSNPNDKFMFTLICGQAKLENDNKGESVKRGLRTKTELGIPSGVAPPGYINAGIEKGNKWFEPDAKRFKPVRRAFHRILSGIEPMESLRILNEEGFLTIKRKKLGGKSLAESTWYEMLRNPVYSGQFISNSEWHRVRHLKFKPMITEEEYWRLQEILGGKGRTRPKLPADNSYLGMFTCGECGAAITRDRKKQVRCVCKHKYSALHRDSCPKCGLHKSKVPEERQHEYHLLHCTKQKGQAKNNQKCSQPSVATEKIEKQLLAKLEGISIPQEFIDWALETLDAQTDETVKTQEEILKSLHEADDAKGQELFRLRQMYRRGHYEYDGGEQEFEGLVKKLMAEQKAIKEKINQVERGNDQGQGQLEQVYTFAKNALQWFRSGERRTRVQILNTLSAKGVIRDKTLGLTVDAVFVEIENAVDAIKLEFPSFEPASFGEFCLVDSNQDTVAAIKSTWLRIVDDVRTIFQRQSGYIYIPDLSSQGQI